MHSAFIQSRHRYPAVLLAEHIFIKLVNFWAIFFPVISPLPSFIFLFDLLAYKKVLISGSSIRKYYIGRSYSVWKRTDILSIFFRFFFLCFILGSSYSYSSNSRVFSFAILVCHPTGLFFISDIVVFIYFFVYVLSVCAYKIISSVYFLSFFHVADHTLLT